MWNKEQQTENVRNPCKVQIYELNIVEENVCLCIALNWYIQWGPFKPVYGRKCSSWKRAVGDLSEFYRLINHGIAYYKTK